MINNTFPLRLAVTGVTGRMGKKIVQRIIEKQNQKISKEIVLGAAIARPLSKFCGMDVGLIVQSSEIGVIITDDIKLVKDDFDVIIDFTISDATIEYLKFCVLNEKNMVIGTTGLSQDQFFLLKNASKRIGIVYSANFSVGVTIMLKLLKKISKIIEKNVDIDIIEVHHNKKKDMPSGTALMMRDIIEKYKSSYDFFSNKSVFPSDVGSCNDNSCSKLSLPSLNNKISIHSIRSGDVIGEHTAVFSSIGESLGVTHKVTNRMIFVDGALRSAVWVRYLKTGLFNLSDVLGFNM